MLSIEEMRQEIKKYCYTKQNCYGCPLRNNHLAYCYTGVSSEEIEQNYNTLINNGCIENKNNMMDTKHLNGYIFDSLMYRYQLARERQLMYEIMEENTNPETARHRYGHDVMKFREILEEVIGEHD